MSNAAPKRAHFQQLADSVCYHAAAKNWPAVTYLAAFTSVAHPGAARRTLEGNSIFWNPDWDTEADSVDHRVGVRSGEPAWRIFLAAALYPDLLRADGELLKH